MQTLHFFTFVNTILKTEMEIKLEKDARETAKIIADEYNRVFDNQYKKF